MNTLERADTMSLQRPYPPYDWYDRSFGDLQPIQREKIRIKEDWFFDKHRSMLDVRILGICPIVEDYDEKGDFRAFKPLFWIYFPEARNIFAKAEVFNRMNSSNRSPTMMFSINVSLIAIFTRKITCLTGKYLNTRPGLMPS